MSRRPRILQESHLTKNRSCARQGAGRVTHSARLRSVCKKQSLGLDEPRCRDFMFPLFPLFLFLEDVLGSLISLSILQWNGLCRMKAEYAGYAGRVLSYTNEE